jgi:hypothetical protein
LKNHPIEPRRLQAFAGDAAELVGTASQCKVQAAERVERKKAGSDPVGRRGLRGRTGKIALSLQWTIVTAILDAGKAKYDPLT